MVELQVMRGDEVVHVRAVGRTPLHIGRAPTNDLVLTDRQISSRHAVVWIEGDEVRVEDLGSRNGTFVGEQQIKGVVALEDGARLRLGPNTVLRVVGRPGGEEIRLVGALQLEDLDAGVRYPIRSDRFHLGSGEDADLRLPDGPARVATILVHGDGEVRLGTDEDDQPLEIGEAFEVAGRKLVLREAGDVSRTEGVESTTYPYRLHATLDGPTGAEALVEDLRTGKRHRIDTENRATMLYLLARQQLRDREEGKTDAEAGWCTDDDVVTGIWGKGKDRLDPNNYHVLVCRMRKELKDAGFDAWFIEKRRKHIRVRLRDVVVDEPIR